MPSPLPPAPMVWSMERLGASRRVPGHLGASRRVPTRLGASRRVSGRLGALRDKGNLKNVLMICGVRSMFFVFCKLLHTQKGHMGYRCFVGEEKASAGIHDITWRVSRDSQ